MCLSVPAVEAAARIEFPVAIVARAGLGTINHSLLTLEAVERGGLSVAGLVLSRHETDDPAAAEATWSRSSAAGPAAP